VVDPAGRQRKVRLVRPDPHARKSYEMLKQDLGTNVRVHCKSVDVAKLITGI
jgi:hypothetical protein